MHRVKKLGVAKAAVLGGEGSEIRKSRIKQGKHGRKQDCRMCAYPMNLYSE